MFFAARGGYDAELDLRKEEKGEGCDNDFKYVVGVGRISPQKRKDQEEREDCLKDKVPSTIPVQSESLKCKA